MSPICPSTRKVLAFVQAPRMSHWKLTLSYNGTSFHGWQVQPGLPTIQGRLAAALHHVTGETVLPQGSGRTDTGVHALAQVASVTLAGPIPAANLHRALNHVLPPSIRILSAEEVPASFHARHSARSKTYEYRIFERRASASPDTRICSPFLAPFVWDCRWPLDLPSMQQAATHLLGSHDFTSFAATDPDRVERDSSSSGENSDPGGNVRCLHLSLWIQEPQLLLYRVRGNGFLHHMVRNLVGTFLEVGRGNLAETRISTILESRARERAGPTAPARGLFLVNVEYCSGN